MANWKKKLKQLLVAEIERCKQKRQELIIKKAEAEAGTSWSSTLHLVVEQDMAINDSRAERCEQILRLLEKRGQVFIVTIRRDDSNRKEQYVVVNADRTSIQIGNYYVVSRSSPIGEAVWGKKKGPAQIRTPDGTVKIEILKVA